MVTVTQALSHQTRVEALNNTHLTHEKQMMCYHAQITMNTVRTHEQLWSLKQAKNFSHKNTKLADCRQPVT